MVFDVVTITFFNIIIIIIVIIINITSQGVRPTVDVNWQFLKVVFNLTDNSSALIKIKN